MLDIENISYRYGGFMYISFDYYRIFYYVAKYGNISEAAKILMSNQPNMSRTIKKLESELGCALFTRSRKGMKLTTEGHRLYGHIKIAVEQIELGQAQIRNLTDMDGGEIIIAASEKALHCLLLPVLKKFRTLYPKIIIRISNHSTPQAIDALADGYADIAVVTTPTSIGASLKETVIKPIKEFAVCSGQFPELAEKEVTLKELTQYPLITLGRDSVTNKFYRNLLEAHGLLFEPDIEANTADQIIPMVEAGLGIGFVPEEFLKNHNDVFKINLKEEIPEREIVLVKRKDQPLSTAAKELERLIFAEIELPTNKN